MKLTKEYRMLLENIRTIRIQKGYSQRVISDALELDRSVACNIEKGKRMLKADDLPRIAEVLGVSTGELFSYGPTDTRPSEKPLMYTVNLTFSANVTPEHFQRLLESANGFGTIKIE